MEVQQVKQIGEERYTNAARNSRDKPVRGTYVVMIQEGIRQGLGENRSEVDSTVCVTKQC